MSMMLPAFTQAKPNITDHRPSVFLIAVSLLVLLVKLSTVTPTTKNIQRVYRNRAQKHIRLMRLGADAGALLGPPWAGNSILDLQKSFQRSKQQSWERWPAIAGRRGATEETELPNALRNLFSCRHVGLHNS